MLILKTRTKIALARLMQWPIMLARRLVGRGPDTRVWRGGILWDLDLREGIDFSIYLTGAFDRETIRAYSSIVEPGMTVLDIGANVGAHALHLAKLVGPEGKVIAFEPTDWAYKKLCANLALNQELASRVLAVQTFLAEDAGDGEIGQIYASWPLDAEDVHPKLRGRQMPTKGAMTTTLDGFLKDQDGTIGFMKIDVDGRECRVLRGAVKTLRRHRPVLIMELSPYVLTEHGSSLEELLGLVKEAGYEIAHMGSGAPLPEDPVKRAAMVPDGAGINFIARPVGRG
jgi:FkbM family methyltransferase